MYTCMGLGSCVGVIAADFEANVSGMLHLMLPETFKGSEVTNPAKFADTGIPELFRLLESAGARRNRLVLAYCGGSQVFKNRHGATLDIGARNSIAVESQLRKIQARVIATDVGGSLGRTLVVDCRSGLVTVRTVARGERTLCNLRNPEKQEAA
ncbi:hypothetical protein QM565_04485 [Geitlerinema splendidum]|nr:hypothetical protein [Geitlerinema splendidum]